MFGNNMVATDFNFYGPRLPTLSRYLRSKSGGLAPDVEFLPLYRQDVIDELERMDGVRILDLKIRAAYASTVAQIDRHLGGALEIAGNLAAGQGEEIELVLRTRSRSRGFMARSREIVRTAIELARRPDIGAGASKFSLKGIRSDTGRMTTVDILRNQLVERKSIVCHTNSGRALNHFAAYEAIAQAFEDRREELLTASGVAL